jgi:hypothetical protein
MQGPEILVLRGRVRSDRERQLVVVPARTTQNDPRAGATVVAELLETGQKFAFAAWIYAVDGYVSRDECPFRRLRNVAAPVSITRTAVHAE